MVNSVLEFVADPTLLRLSIVVIVWAGSFLMFTSCCISNKRIFLSKVHESKWDLPPQFYQVGFALSVGQNYTDHLLFSLVVHHSHLFEDNSFILNSIRGRLAGVVLGGLSPIILDVVIGTKDVVFDVVALVTEVIGAGLHDLLGDNIVAEVIGGFVVEVEYSTSIVATTVIQTVVAVVWDVSLIGSWKSIVLVCGGDKGCSQGAGGKCFHVNEKSRIIYYSKYDNP